MSKGKIKLTLAKFTSSLKIENIIIDNNTATYNIVVTGESFNGYVFITIDTFSNIKRSTAADTKAGSLAILSTEGLSHRERIVPITIGVGTYPCELSLNTVLLSSSEASEVEASVGYCLTPDLSLFIGKVILNNTTEPI